MEEEGSSEGERTSPSCRAECSYIIKRCCRTVCLRIWEYIKLHRKLLYAVFGGQILALFLCGTGVTSQALEEFHNIAVPTTQLFFVYFLMAFIFGPVLVCRKNVLTVVKENWWKYIILGVIDVEANFLVVSAYKYTTLTSIQVLDSFTIVVVLVLSFIFLRSRYLIVHVVGVIMCMVGILSLILADLKGSRSNTGSDPLFGDLLCLAGTVLYAISNIAQEYLVKNHSRIEWLALIGIVGSVVSGIQVSVLERVKIASISWNSSVGGLFFVFVFSLFLFYSLMPVIMKISNAVVINLSLLTADIYTLVFGIFLFNYKFSVLYVMAFIIILVGVFVFNLKSPPTAQPKLTLHRLKNKLKRRRRGNQKNEEEEGDETTDSRTLTPVHRVAQKSDPDLEGILVRGPLEARLTSLSYSTVYSESMSYSYGSNSINEGSEILKRLKNNGGLETKYQQEKKEVKVVKHVDFDSKQGTDT